MQDELIRSPKLAALYQDSDACSGSETSSAMDFNLSNGALEFDDSDEEDESWCALTKKDDTNPAEVTFSE